VIIHADIDILPPQSSASLKDQKLKISLFPEQLKATAGASKILQAVVSLIQSPVTKVGDTTTMFSVARDAVPIFSTFLEFSQKVYDSSDAAPHLKKQLNDSLTTARKAFRSILAACRIVSDASGGKDIDWALEYLASASAELDGASVDVNAKLLQLARVEGGKENALELLEVSLR
jgi:hypothetical protein